MVKTSKKPSLDEMLDEGSKLKEDSNFQLQINSLKEEKLKLQKEIKDLKELSKNDKKSDVVMSMKLAKIKLAPNVRGNEKDSHDYEDIESIAKNIGQHGQLQPVLLSKDDYLIAGSRRYKAFEWFPEAVGFDEILIIKYHKKMSEISPEELQDLQLSENKERKDLDNFQISTLYNDLIDQGYDQKKISERFKKSKSFVSKVIKINNIDPELVKLLKQFQIYGWSKAKLNAFNFEENGTDGILKDLEKCRGIVGISTLLAIGRSDNPDEQKKVFLKKFNARLHADDAKIFEGIEIVKEKKKIADKGLKQVEALAKLLSTGSTSFTQSKEYESIQATLKSLKKHFNKVPE